MKKLYPAVLLGLAVATSFTSCQDDDSLNLGNTSELQVAVGINDLQSRAGIRASSFSGKEAIGLYLYRGEGIDDKNRDYNADLAATLESPVNVKYKRDETGGWWTSSNPVILSSTEGILYSYYPYSSVNDKDDGKAIAIKVNSEQGTGQSDGLADVPEQTDYMWGTPVEGVSSKSDKVNIELNHALAMLTFKFVKRTYGGPGIISSIVLRNADGKGVVRIGEATLNIADGTINHTATTTGYIAVTPDASQSLVDVKDENKLPRMLVYPATGNFAAGDAQFVITMDGQNYTLDVPSVLAGNIGAYKWQAGKNYIYTFKLDGHALGSDDEEGRDDVTVNVNEWVPQNVDGGTLENPDGQKK